MSGGQPGEECGLEWEAASAGLVWQPDQSRDAPTADEDAGPWPAGGFHGPCGSSHHGQKASGYRRDGGQVLIS